MVDIARTDFPQPRLRPALFLDRDGVINEETGYAHRQEDIRFVPGIFELVAAANAAARPVIVVTNQSGIGRGYYSEAVFHELMDWMNEQFKTRGARLDGVYFCPHHPEHGQGEYKTLCQCRKPAPGMFLKAAADHGIDLGRSLMLGDSLHDLEAAKAAGVGTLVHLVRGQAPCNQTPCGDAPRLRNGIHEITGIADAIALLG